MDEQGLIERLKSKTLERWGVDQQPYLLSLAASDLADDGIDYRSILADERLKSFVKRAADAGAFKVVEHPMQRAKVGLVPSDKAFTFESEIETLAVVDSRDSIRPLARDQAVIAFLRALSRLPDSVLDEVVIPTKVLVRLLARK